MRYLYPVVPLLFFLSVVSCAEQQRSDVTPWGSALGQDTVPSNSAFGLNDIINNGEIIMLTISGPETYYDYHGKGMGLQYLLCEQFAQALGVSLRVELCRDTTELITRIKNGDGDIVAFQLPQTLKGVCFAGATQNSGKTGWAVQPDNKELADTLNRWFKPEMIAEITQRERFLLSTRSVTRRVYSPMLNRSQGIISRYDHYFQRYAPIARWDWRLMAAQCYQESTFDPMAQSWAGARGLMQIMPATATHLGLPLGSIHNPEDNIAAAAKYIKELNARFADVPASERVSYVLASYNGGHYHIRDAMALARKNGKDPNRWENVKEFVLKLSSPAYYRDKVVKYGYMRGSETVDYVEKINSRWAQYRGVARGGSGAFMSPSVPERAKRGNRWSI
ncbi:transglycosylase SLT domain protein [Hallella bergensis DSM 17361]|uniref:Transglycosylase SLT domain protein n=1 Tax=Hallella bergensis DSM 17361 TaxID=585502 RepID=D1PYE6_9BACT|nr:transglycosylase SLT domain-containing protein [Hallella bergensis]EFA43611.1 transglycosylase SLT domain protein [Hallella bergensis DSM 17361]